MKLLWNCELDVTRATDLIPGRKFRQSTSSQCVLTWLQFVFNYTLSSLIMKASLSIINRLLWLLLLFGSFPGKTLSSQYIYLLQTFSFNRFRMSQTRLTLLCI
jgi:hypothetical protein